MTDSVIVKKIAVVITTITIVIIITTVDIIATTILIVVIDISIIIRCIIIIIIIGLILLAYSLLSIIDIASFGIITINTITMYHTIILPYYAIITVFHRHLCYPSSHILCFLII